MSSTNTHTESPTPGAEHAEWDLEGVSCADCARKAALEVALLDGIETARIHVLSSRLLVDYAQGSLDVASVERALGTEGIRLAGSRAASAEAEAESGGAAEPRLPRSKAWRSPQAHRTWISGGFFFLGLAAALFTSDTLLVSLVGWRLPFSGTFFLVASAVGGWNFFPGGVRSFLRRRLDMQVLMSIAILGAIGIGEFTEAASIAFLFSFAELLEDFAVDRARDSLRALMAVAPDTANLISGGSTRRVAVEEVAVGDVVAVRAGERIPVDGTIREGTGSVDQSPVTGESIPVDMGTGDTVFAGSVLKDGYLEVAARNAFGDSTLQRVVRLIEEAEGQKSPAERFVDRFAAWYTPSVVLLAILVAAFPPLLFGAPFAAWFLRALTLLVIACPCALVISTPVSVVSALAAGSRAGVLIKGGVHLETLGRIRSVAFDKTGTLTTGAFHLSALQPFGDLGSEEALRIAAALEGRSSHPLAAALTAAWSERQGPADLPGVSGFGSLNGRGVQGEVEGVRWRIGRPDLFDASEAVSEWLSAEDAAGSTAVLLGTPDGLAVAGFRLRDTVRADARDAVEALRDLGVGRILMLTGDEEGAARDVARRIGITEVHAGLLPEDKLDILQRIGEESGPVAMVGDGINDGPALAAADVGIAMGAAGTDTALETSDVALMSDDLGRLPFALSLSRRAERVIRQNIAFSLALKFLLAVGVFPGAVTLIVAVLVGDMGAALAVTANALRLARR